MIMSTKADRNFVKSQMSSTEESTAKFASLETVAVKQTRNRIRPIENKESAKVRKYSCFPLLVFLVWADFY